MAYYDYQSDKYVSDEDIAAQAASQRAKSTSAPKPQIDPVTGQAVPSFMGNPAVQRMQAMQAAGGTGRAVPQGGGGLGGLPLLQMLAPYLSQQGRGMPQGRGGALPIPAPQQGGPSWGNMLSMMGQQPQGGMSPLIAQLLPMLLAQQQQAGRRP